LASTAIDGTVQPKLVAERDIAIAPSAGGQIITAVNIPALNPEIVSADTASLHVPAALTASAAQPDENEVALQPRLVAGRELSLGPSSRNQIIAAVDIPALRPDIVAGDSETPHTAAALSANKALSSASEVVVQPRPVTGRDISSMPPNGHQIDAAIDIPGLRPNSVAVDSNSLHPSAAPHLNASEITLQPRLVTGHDIAAMPSQGHQIIAAIDIPELRPDIVAVDSKSLHAPAALAANLAPIYSARSAMRPVPVSERRVPAVPPVSTRMVATATIPRMWTVNSVAPKPQQTLNAKVLVTGRPVLLIGHPLVLVNASGHHDTPASIGRRLSGLGWSVAKSVETAPRVQAKTLIIYQKSKGAAAMALARTLFLTPRLTADKNAVGLRLVLGSDLSSSIFKAHLSPVSGKRIKLADAGYQSRE
jgi:hypothetical protein